MSDDLSDIKDALRAAIHALHEAQEAVSHLEDRRAATHCHEAIVDAYRCFDRVLELTPPPMLVAEELRDE